MPFLSAILKHPYLLVAIGGAIGSVGRAGVTDWMTRRLGEGFPFGTVLVNVTGAVLMGLLAGYGATVPGKLLLTQSTRSFLMIGILGGYTTFSSFSLQTFLLLEQGNVSGALLNVLLSVILCIAGIWIGFSVMKLL